MITLKTVANYIGCVVFDYHQWTCSAQEGILPTKEQIESGVKGFKSYAKMYCKNCKKQSKLSL